MNVIGDAAKKMGFLMDLRPSSSPQVGEKPHHCDLHNVHRLNAISAQVGEPVEPFSNHLHKLAISLHKQFVLGLSVAGLCLFQK